MQRIGWVVLAACTHHHPLGEIAQHANGTVDVKLTNGAVVNAHVEAYQQGTILRGQDGTIIPPEMFVDIRTTDHVRGGLEGLGLGVVIGAGAGIAIGYAEGDTSSDEECILACTGGQKAALAGFLLGTLGGLVGLVAGAVTGSDDEYTVERTAPVTPVGPPGSVAGFTVRF